MTMTLFQAVIFGILSVALYIEAIHSIFATNVDLSSTLSLLLGGILMSGTVIIAFF